MKEYFISLIYDLLKATLGGILTYIYTNRKKLKMMLQCSTSYRNKEIRVSLSYLYRIKCKDKYLLVKNRKFAEQYQPVGGVYKSFNTASKCFNELGVHQYYGFNYEEEFKNDLRVKVLSRNLNKFLEWFHSRQDREVDPIREFHEELISPGYLSKDVFSYFDYRFIKQKITPIKYSKYYQCNEVLVYNIYELLPTEIQEKELEDLMSNQNSYYRWFTIDEIECLGHTREGDYRIGEHTLLIK